MKSTMKDNSQDVKIATLKAQAFELSQKLRDYQSLNEQYLNLQSKFQQLQEEQVRNGEGFSSHIETINIDGVQLLRQLEDLKCLKHQLIEKQDCYQTDFTGLKKHNDDLFLKLDVKKQQLHQKTDIVHMLNLEMKEQG